MDLGRILLSLLGLCYFTYKWIKNRKSLDLFWILLLIYSLTSLTFIINPENFIYITKILDTIYVKFINFLLLLGMIIVLGNIIFNSIKLKNKISSKD